MKYKRIVVKIGTSVIAKKDGRLNIKILESLTKDISTVLSRDIDVIIVSSGAIGAGLGMLGEKRIPDSLSELQAIAAIGQSELMHRYGEFFKKMGYIVGQILLTQEDFNDRRRYLNIKYTVETLISKRVVPVVNENDTVSTEEIKCGDNDRISSLVADLVGADALIILTDVDGLYDREGNLIREVDEISDYIKSLTREKSAFFTRGGMSTKLQAAQRVMYSGIDCYIANGKKTGIISDILKGNGKFTYFRAKWVRKKARERWIAYASKVKGIIFVDDGAKQALVEGKKSLLSTGIIDVKGRFAAGDTIEIADNEKRTFAKGLTNYSSNEIKRIRGLKTSQIESVLGYKDHDEVVHKDNLVIL